MTKETKANKDLKKHNRQLKHQYDLLQIRYNALQHKCEDLKKENEYLTNELNKCMIERNDYLSRNEKAIGLINQKLDIHSDWVDYDFGVELLRQELLNILQRRDKK